jgi:hypothetical protein
MRIQCLAKSAQSTTFHYLLLQINLRFIRIQSTIFLWGK